MPAKCEGCGKDIVWGTTASGERIPLDFSAPVYQVNDDAGRIKAGLWSTAERRRRFKQGEAVPMVSHFATCPKANDFSRSKK